MPKTKKIRILVLIIVLIFLVSALYFSYTNILIKDSLTQEKVNSGWIATINLHLFRINFDFVQGGSSMPTYSQPRIAQFQDGKYSFASYSLHFPFNIVKNKVICVFVPGYKVKDDPDLEPFPDYDMNYGMLVPNCFKMSPFSIKKTIYLEKATNKFSADNKKFTTFS